MAPTRMLRKFTVTVTADRSWPTCRQVPQIRMRGAWLGQAGFLPGTWLDVAVSAGMLVISVAADPIQPDPELVKRAMEELQRDDRRRFPKRQRKG
jgi:hypothetical protein